MNKIISFIVRIFFYIVIGVVLLFGTVVFGISWVLFSAFFALYPAAELPRDNNGFFLVTTENFQNLSVMSRINKSKIEIARFSEQLYLRPIGSVTETCSGIKNCKNYESVFLQYDRKNPTVYLIRHNDLERFDSYEQALKRSINAHNRDAARDYDVVIDYDKPELPDVFSVKLSTFNDETGDKSKAEHDLALKLAASQCWSYNQSCLVDAFVNYCTPFLCAKVRVER